MKQSISMTDKILQEFKIQQSTLVVETDGYENSQFGGSAVNLDYTDRRIVKIN